MRILICASAALLMASAPALAHDQASTASDGRQAAMDPNGPAVPPGDGITARGEDPEGQAFIPPGYNSGPAISVYPPVVLAPAGMIGGAYPVCSKRVTDRCVQAYSRYARR